MPEKRDLEMLSREVFGHMQEGETKKEKASLEAKKMRE